jgi:hypothetical protein
VNGVFDLRYCVQGQLQGPLYVSQKESFSQFDQKVEKNKIRMILSIRVPSMGCFDDGHMTNYQKCSKMKVVALHCSFQNQLKLCFKVLPLWRCKVKDI